MRTGKLLATVVFSLLAWPSVVFAVSFSEAVSIDISPLAGQTGYLAFDLIGGDSVQNSTVEISGFSSDGVDGALAAAGDATGGIAPGPGFLGDSGFFNEFLQQETFGSTISFRLAVSSSYAGNGVPDSLSFYVLDGTQNTYATDDPSGANSVVSIDLRASTNVQVYRSDSFTASVTAITSPAPEPAAIVLWLVGAALCRLNPHLSRPGQRRSGHFPRIRLPFRRLLADGRSRWRCPKP